MKLLIIAALWITTAGVFALAVVAFINSGKGGDKT